MRVLLSQESLFPAISASAVGLGVSALIHTPYGLLAPIVALFLFTRRRTELVLLYAVLATGLLGSLVAVLLFVGEARVVAGSWAEFFLVAICIGVIHITRSEFVLGAKEERVHLGGAANPETQTYPNAGPSLLQKAAPRSAPRVGLSARNDENTVKQLVAVSFWGGLPFHLRYWRRQWDGGFRWVESYSEPAPDPSGTRLWRAHTFEIDEGKPLDGPPTKLASDASIEDDAVRAAKLVENLLGNAWAFDPAGRPTYLTPLGQTLVAVTLEEFQAAVDEGHTFFKLTAHPDEYDRVSAAWRRCLQAGEPFFLDRRIKRATGIHEWNRTGFVPTRDKQGRITGWYGSTIDLDSHRVIQAELRQRERELSQLVDLVPSHIWRLTADGQPVFFNKRMVDFLGFDVEGADKRSISRLDAVIEAVHADDAAKFEHTLKHSLSTGETFEMRYRLRRADGAYRWMSSRAEPLRGHAGDIVQWFGVCHDVDDQVRLFHELEERESRIRRLVDSDIIGIVIWDLDGTLIDANDAFLNMVQYTREEVKAGLDWFAMTPPDWQDVHAREEAEELATTGKMQAREKEYFRKDGSRVPVLIGAACFEGQSRQGVAYILDLSDQKRAESALRERERELAKIVDMVPSLLWRLNAKGEPAYLSKRAIEFLGAGVDAYDTPGMSRLSAGIQASVHPEDADMVGEAFQRSMETGTSISLNCRLRRADGVYRWVMCRADPLRDENGGIIEWYGLSHDIDDQVRADRALRESEQRLQDMIDALPIRIWSAAAKDGSIYFNKRYKDHFRSVVANIETLLDRRIDALLGQLVHPDDAPGVERAINRCFETENGAVLRFRWREKGDIYRWAECRVEPRRDESGAVVQWYGASVDIDDEVRAQAELRRTQERLAQASQAASLAELSASIAHEVNQPLAAVIANSHACQRWLTVDPPNLERAQKTLERIIRDANGAADVVSRIRALFKQDLRARNGTSLGAVIAEAERLVSDLAMRHNVFINVHVGRDVPPVAIDRVQIQQVLINLMRNGVEAMASTRGGRLLAVRASKVEGAVRVEVCDNGVGVEDAERIFDAFYSTKESGMGMGLIISRSIVESHGGRLWAERNEEEGTTFVFTIPVKTKGEE